MTRALLLSEHDLDGWYARYLAGEVPAPLPYGVDALQEAGFSLRGAARASEPAWRRVRDVVEHRVGFPVERAIRGARVAGQADVVIALLEREGFAAGMAKRAGLAPYARTPLVIWSCWLADDLRRADPKQRRQLVDRVRSADLITHFGPAGGEVLASCGIPHERTVELTWGVNEKYYRPSDGSRDIEILAVGQDRGRDYATLFQAVDGTDLSLDLVCKTENVAGLAIPANVRLHAPVSLTAYRDLLQRAQVVAVPTHDLIYPTGSSVALEAAASGCAVVLTGTRALRGYLQDGINGRLIDVGDAEGWRSVLVELRDDQGQRERLGAAARRSVESTFNARRMWTELAAVLRERGIV